MTQRIRTVRIDLSVTSLETTSVRLRRLYQVSKLSPEEESSLFREVVGNIQVHKKSPRILMHLSSITVRINTVIEDKYARFQVEIILVATTSEYLSIDDMIYSPFWVGSKVVGQKPLATDP